MAYIITWDASSPDGAITPAADIDQEIQDLKASLGERLVQVIPEWADDLADPKKIAIVVDVIANRPATPDFQGEMFFATDTQTLYIADATPEWKSTGGIAVEEGDDTVISQTFFCHAHLAATATVPNTDVWQKLGGWIVDNEYGSFYNGILPFQFKAPATGQYKISANVVAAQGPLSISIGRQGSAPVMDARGLTNTPGSQSMSNLNMILNIVADAYIEFYVKNSGTATSFVYHPYSHMTIHRLP